MQVGATKSPPRLAFSFSTARGVAAAFCAAATLLCAPGADATGIDHSTWDRILRSHVDDEGRVAYRDLAARDSASLGEYLRSVASAEVSSMTRDEALAFYINAYNACIFEAVLDGATAETFFGRVRMFGLRKFVVGGERMTLDTLEKKVILPRFDEPRVHFALVCASASCPRLAPRAWTAGELDAMLDARTREFLADRARNPFGDGPRVRLSKIFDWYRGDFESPGRPLAAFLARYSGADAPGCLDTNDCVYEFEDYDWSLNAQHGQRP